MDAERRDFSRPQWVFIAAVSVTLAFALFGIWMMSREVCEVWLVLLRDCQSRWDQFLEAPANEVGDTLAGFASGLALIWIVASVVIQRMELLSTVRELRAATEIEKQRETAGYIKELLADFRRSLVEDLESLASVTWRFDPNPLGKFGTGGQQEASLEGLDQLDTKSDDFFEKAEVLLSRLAHRLGVLADNCKIISAPSGKYYQLLSSEIVHTKLQVAKRHASKATIQMLHNNRIDALGYTVVELNGGSWWQEK